MSEPPSGELRVVATPIGNLSDLSPRAVEALRTADVILAEDTRRTRALLTHLGIAGVRLERFDAEVERRDVEHVVSRLRAGERVTLVSDAGMPGVSDPGAALVRAAAAAGVLVVPVAGPSAVTSALAASGLSAGGHRFFGFLPRRGGERARALERVRDTEELVVLFESAERLPDTLKELAVSMPERAAVIAREMSKLHEEFVRGTLAEVSALERAWRGEITVVLGPRAADAQAPLDEEALDARIDKLVSEGLRPREVAKTLALETGVAASEIYARMHRAGRRPARGED